MTWIWLSVYVWLWNCGAMVEHHTNGELWWRVRWLRSLSGRLSSWWIVPPDWWCAGLWLWQTTIAPSSAIFHGSPLFSPGPTIGWSHSQETDSEGELLHRTQNCHHLPAQGADTRWHWLQPFHRVALLVLPCQVQNLCQLSAMQINQCPSPLEDDHPSRVFPRGLWWWSSKT